jgi:hypothetical protein
VERIAETGRRKRVNFSQPPRIAKALLKIFGNDSNSDAILGDIAERFRTGKSRAWYWKEVLIAIALTGFRGPVLLGTVMGIVSGGFSVAGNIARGDLHTVTPYPNVSGVFIAPLIAYMVFRYWLKHGSMAEEVRSAMRSTAMAYGIVFTLINFVFGFLWFSRPVGYSRIPDMVPMLVFVAILVFLLMYSKIRLVGYLATRLPVRGISK